MSHDAIYNCLLDYGLSETLVIEVGNVLANDDWTKEDLGRSPVEQQLVFIAWLFIREEENKRRKRWKKINKLLTGNGGNPLKTHLP
jgi:hypothetical protein